MPENPHLRMLDREGPAKVVQQNFTPQLDLLQQLTNFGSNLVLRAYNSSGRKLEDAISCYVLLKHFVSMLDATEILLRSGAVHAAHLPARAAFEASLYVHWILVSDPEKKARYYYVANLRNERLWALRGMQGSAEGQAFAEGLKDLAFDIHANEPNLSGDARKYLAEVNRILSQPEYKSIDEEFEKKKGRAKYDPEWYKVLGPKSIRELAGSLKRLPEYDLFYSKASQVTHTASYKDHLRFLAHAVRYKPVRNVDGLDSLLHFVMQLAVRTFQLILQYYRPGELRNYWKTYLEEWRQPFLNVTSVKYEF